MCSLFHDIDIGDNKQDTGAAAIFNVKPEIQTQHTPLQDKCNQTMTNVEQKLLLLLTLFEKKEYYEEQRDYVIYKILSISKGIRFESCKEECIGVKLCERLLVGDECVKI